MSTTLTATPADPTTTPSYAVPVDGEVADATPVQGLLQTILNWVAWLRAKTVAVANGADTVDGPIRGYLGYNVGTSTLVSGSLSPGTTVSRTAAGIYRVTNSRITVESVCVASPSITGAVTVSTSAASGHAQITLESSAGSNFDGDLHISFVVYP